MIPTIIDITKNGKESVDIFSYHLKTNRKIYLTGEIDDILATEIIAQLEYLDSISTEDITLYINSPGGSVSAGFAIVDCMARCHSDVSTVCTGIAASMGAFILANGKKGKRYATPMSEILLHQPLGGVHGQASDIEKTAEHILKVKKKLLKTLSQNTGRTYKQICEDCDRDYWLNAEEAIEYGLVDKVFIGYKK